jgi:hypothetical protein
MGKGKRKEPEKDGLTGTAHQIDPNSKRAQRHQARNGAETEEGGQQQASEEHTQAENRRGETETSKQGEERATASGDEEATDSRASSSDSESDSSEKKKARKAKKAKKAKKEKKEKKGKKPKGKGTEDPQLTLEQLKQVLLRNPEMAQSLLEDAQVKV